MKVSQVRPEFTSRLRQLAEDSRSNFAWRPDSSHLIPIQPTRVFTVAEGQTLHIGLLPVPKDTLLSLTSQAELALKHQFPELQGPIDGIKLIVNVAETFEAWSDPNRTSFVKPVLKTSQVLLETLEALKPFIPQLQTASPGLETVGLILKVGDAVYECYLLIRNPAA